MSINNVINDKKKALLAYKEKILDDIKYTERSIDDFRTNFKNKCFYDDHVDSSESEDDFASAIDMGPSITQLKLQEAMMKTCLHATQELTSLMVLQSEVDVLVEEPKFERERPVTEPGTWREVTVECRIDLVPFTMTFFMHTPDRRFAPLSYRGLRVVPVKSAHELELSKSVLHSLKLPSDAVEVLRSYAAGYRSRRTTLARLANKYTSALFMEPHAEGGFILKCVDLLEVSWRLENKWSPVAPFHHRMKFDLEFIEESYIKIITQAHKQLLDPALQTDERTLLLAKIITTCLEARGTIDPESDLESKTTERDNDIDRRDSASEKRDSEVMAPPKSLPKKGKQKNKGSLPNTAQKRSMDDENGGSVAKKMKNDVSEAKNTVVDANNARKSKISDVANEGAKKRKMSEVNKVANNKNVKEAVDIEDGNANAKNVEEAEDETGNIRPKNVKVNEDKAGNTKPKNVKETGGKAGNIKAKNVKETGDNAGNTKTKNAKEADDKAGNTKPNNAKVKNGNTKFKNVEETGDKTGNTRNVNETEDKAGNTRSENAKVTEDKPGNTKPKNVKETEDKIDNTINVKETEDKAGNTRSKNAKETEDKIDNTKSNNAKEIKDKVNSKTKNAKESENKTGKNNPKNIKESENNAKPKNVEDETTNTNLKPKNTKESASVDSKNTNAKTKNKVTNKASGDATKDINSKPKTKVLKKPANVGSDTKLKEKIVKEGKNQDKENSAEKNITDVQNKGSASKNDINKELTNAGEVKNLNNKSKNKTTKENGAVDENNPNEINVRAKNTENIKLSSVANVKSKELTKVTANKEHNENENNVISKNIKKKPLKKVANTKSKENVDANKDAGLPKGKNTEKITNAVKNIESNVIKNDNKTKNTDANKLKNVVNTKTDDQTTKKDSLRTINDAGTKNDDQAKKSSDKNIKNKEKLPEVANKDSENTLKEKIVKTNTKNVTQTVKKVTEKNATTIKNKDKISLINKVTEKIVQDKPVLIKDIPAKVLSSDLITKKTNSTNTIIKKPIVHKIASHRNSLKPQNPPKVLKVANTKIITTGKSEEENGGKGSKIPQKAFSTISEGSSKKNLLRISPRKIPSKFKTTSQDTFKQKMVKSTNIPRLLKKPAPKTT